MCGGTMKHVGAGTQRVEEELRELFPEAGILRMDADTASGRHEKILTQFERERISILLTQVVGRAGRGGREGRAVIQTYTPENDVIQSAARQDYESFYESEIRIRRMRRYPPFADFFTFSISGVEEGGVLRAAAVLR